MAGSEKEIMKQWSRGGWEVVVVSACVRLLNPFGCSFSEIGVYGVMLPAPSRDPVCQRKPMCLLS